MKAARKHVVAAALLAATVMAFILYHAARAQFQQIGQQLREFHKARRGVPHTHVYHPDDAAPGIHPLLESLHPSEYTVASNRVSIAKVFRVGPVTYRRQWTLEAVGQSWRLFYSDSVVQRPRHVWTVVGK